MAGMLWRGILPLCRAARAGVPLGPYPEHQTLNPGLRFA